MATEALLISINEKGALQVKRNLDGVGKAAARSGKAVNLLKGALAGIAAVGLGVVLVAGVKLLAQFGQEMATVRAITGATEAEFKTLNDTALELGKNTRFTAVQAAEGMKFLSRAGFTAAQTLVAVESTLNLAQAGALDLGTAARLTAQAIKGFRLDIDQATRVTDVFALAANSANTDVLQLGDAIKFAAPAAVGLGVSLEETTAAIQLLSDAGLQGTLAGTALRKSLVALESPTKTAEKILDKFGLTSEDVKVSTLGMTQVFKNLRDAGVDTGEMYKLLGVRAGAAGEVLTKVIPELIDNTEKLKNAGGTAQEVARIMDDTLNGALLRTKSAFQAVTLASGRLGADDSLTNFFNGLAAVLRFVSENLDALTKAATAAGVALLFAFGPRIMSSLTLGIKALGGQIVKLWALILANPIVAVVAVIAGAITALILFRDEIDILGDDFATLGDIFTATWNVIKGETVSGVEQVKSDGGDLSRFFQDTFQDLLRVLLAMLQTFLQLIDKAFGLLVGTMRGAAKIGKIAIDAIRSGALPSLKDMGEAFRTELEIGFGNDFFEGFLLDVLNEAEALAGKRQTDAVTALRKKRKVGDVEIAGPGEDGGEPKEKFDQEAAQFEKLIASLKQEGELLKLNNAEREIRQGLLQVEADLDRDLKGTQEEQVLTLLATNQALADQAAILEEIRGPQLAYERSLSALNELKPELTVEEYNKKLKELQDTLKTGEKDAEGLGDVLSGAFDKAGDSLSEFIRTGKADFASLADSILADLARIAAQQAIINFTKSFGFGFQHGGSFTVGGSGGPDSQFVPLALSPGERVDISTQSQQRSRQTEPPPPAPAPQITIINVLDESLVTDIMEGQVGQQAIINTIQRNPTVIRQAIS